MKDLEWVKAKLKKDHKDGEMARSQIKDGEKIDGIDLNSYWRGRQTANYIARCYLEDLDEPETLSEDWIQEHSYNVHLLGTPDVTTVAVPREDLQNLLVPKQEREQKYNVKFKVKSSFGTVGIFLYKKGDEVLAGDNFRAYYPKEDEYRLTEQEIRDFQNGDILFEHFAVKVEELEE